MKHNIFKIFFMNLKRNFRRFNIEVNMKIIFILRKLGLK